MVVGAVIRLTRRDADADHGRRREALLICGGLEEALEELAVQFAEVVGDGELRRGLVDRRQQHAEVEIADIGGEVVPDDPAVALPGSRVEDLRVQDLEQRELLILSVRRELQSDRDDLEFDGVTVPVRVVPVREVVEPAVDHRQGVAEVLFPVVASRQIREVRGGARATRRHVVLVEARGGDAECEHVRHERSILC